MGDVAICPGFPVDAQIAVRRGLYLQGTQAATYIAEKAKVPGGDDN